MRVHAGGVGRYASDLVATFAQRSDVEVVGSGRGSAFTPWGRWLTARSAVKSGPDVVHCTHLETLPVDIPQVVTVHDLIPIQHPASMPSAARRKAFERILRTSLTRAAAVIAPSQLTASSLRDWGIDRVEVIPHGVAARFRPATDDERSAARERFAHGKHYVAAISAAKAHKNVAVLPDVARSLGPEVALVTAGDHLHPGLDSVGLLSDDDLAAFMSGADAFVLPSLIEGFGLPALEAMACGVPVVCGAQVGALEVVGDGATVVDVHDADEIARALERVMTAGDGPRSKAHEATRTLTLDRMAEATLAVYRRVIE